MTVGIDRRPIPGNLIGTVGNDITVTIGLLDLVSGAVTGVGATIVATVGGLSMSVDYSTRGLFVCRLSDSQTVTLGTGAWSWLFRLTPSGGDTQDYVSGRMTLSSSSNAGGSYGYQIGMVGGVIVGIW